MARRRRKRSSPNAGTSPPRGEARASEDPLARRDELAASIAHEGHGEAADDGQSQEHAEAHVHAEQTCLIHMGHEAAMVCDDCQSPMCEVCAFPHGAETVCGDCASLRSRKPRDAQTPWRGWTSMALGLLALGALLAPFTFAADASFSQGLPGGRAFFSYLTVIGGVLGLTTGFSAQDFAGLEKRAGAAGAVMSGLALLASVGLHFLLTFFNSAP